MNSHEKQKINSADSRLFRRRQNLKISDDIIQQIREIFISGQLRPGDKLGSEKELMESFGVSKATLREALRVLEAMGIIEIRKGLMGGVFAAQVDMKTTINSIQGFLKFESVSIYDITMVRCMLEPCIVRIVISQLSDDHINNLQKIIRESRAMDPTQEKVKGISFHRYLARITQNPMLILIMDFIDNLLEDMKKKIGLDEDFYQAMDDYHYNITKHIIDKNVAEAQKTLIQDILATGDVIAKTTGSPAYRPNMTNDMLSAIQIK